MPARAEEEKGQCVPPISSDVQTLPGKQESAHKTVPLEANTENSLK